MRKLHASLSLILLCTAGVGCAAETDGLDTLGSEVEADTQALKKGQLLALGDSIAFGYDPYAGDFSKEHKFNGYPEALKSDFKITNSSCTGETTGSFLSASAPDNGCRAYKSNYPLHVDYAGSPTQMAYALSRITSANPDEVPSLITLNLSGNDIFLAQAACAGTPNPAACFAAGAPALITQIATNVATILGAIRGAGYTGPITYMNLYATNYADANAIAFVTALNGAVSNLAKNSFGAKIADAFGAFQAAAGEESPCDAGLLIPNPEGDGCDVHPSKHGQNILADSVLDAE